MDRRRHRARGVIALFGWALASIVALVVSIVVHAETAVGLRAAEHFFEWSGSETSRGTVHIARVRSVPPGPLSVLGYRIVAPNGETVIEADEMGGMPDARGLLDGEIRFRPSWFVRARIRLTPGPHGQVNLVYASEVPKDTPTIPLVFEDIRLVDNTLFVALPGKPAVTMRHVQGKADLHIGHLWEWRLRDNRGEIDLPAVEPGFRGMNGRLRSDSAHPLVVSMTVDVAVAEPTLSLDYHVPALAGRPGKPYFELDLGGGDTEEEEEARERLAELREELGEAIAEEREERAEGDLEEAGAMRTEITQMRRRMREAEQEADR